MRALDKKLIRDIKRLWAQSLAVALVMAAGVATMLIGLGNYNSLSETRLAYYDRAQFADVFASLVRAPKSLQGRLRAIEGVAQVETRIVKGAVIDIEGFGLPATGRFISLPALGGSLLNRLHVRQGRLPAPGSLTEVVVNESFARAHGFAPGASFTAILNGARRRLTITATVLSPEFIYALGPGEMIPDDRRFAIVWMRETALASLFDLDGAFNDVTLRAQRKAGTAAIIDAVDALLKRHGGLGAYDRGNQLSHAFLDAELKQLRTMSAILPPIFLIVSAFLINMVLTRLITLEREQIGLLKALGYSSAEIVMHYLKLVTLIALLGVAIGFAAGTWLSRGMTNLYTDFFHFPFSILAIPYWLYALSATVAVAAAIAGALRAAVNAASLSPAVAMQAPAPPVYRRIWRFHWQPLRHFSQITTMVLRQLIRWPARALLTTLGIALSISILVGSLFSNGSVDFMLDVVFERADRQDMTIAFSEAKPLSVLREVERLPGVLKAEPYRAAPVRLSNLNFSKRVAIFGKPRRMDLSRVLDLHLKPVTLPERGLVLSEMLANILHVRSGDMLHVEFLGSVSREVEVPVIGVIQSYIGLSAFMDLDALSQVIGEAPRADGIHVLLDTQRTPEFFKAVKEQPSLSFVSLQRVALTNFRKTIGENIGIQITVLASLAIVIAFGVVYNSARIQFSERARELASLRVLGFTDFEVSHILLLEIAILTIAAIPLGWLIGAGFAFALTTGFQSELYRLPLIIERTTYAYSALIVIAAVAISAFIVRRRVSRLDLVRVLKTRD